MKWWRMFRRPKTDGGAEAREHLARVRSQQPQVDEMLGRLDDRVERNQFRLAFQDALSPRRKD